MPRLVARADQHAEIGNERDQPRAQANEKAEFEPDQGQSDGVEDAEDQADRRLAADEAGQGTVDLAHLGADGGRGAARQKHINSRHDAVPVTQQVEGDERRDDHEREDIEQRHAAAPQVLKQAPDPLDGLAGIGSGGAAQAFHGVRGEARLKVFEYGRRVFAQHPGVVGNARNEGHHLDLQKGKQKHRDARRQKKENNRDQCGRHDPRTAPFLQAVSHGIKEIGNRHAGDEGHQHAAQERKKDGEDADPRQPRDGAHLSAHLPFSKRAAARLHLATYMVPETRVVAATT